MLFRSPKIKMPQLVDRTYRSAIAELARVGLKLGKVIYVNDLAQQTVRRQLVDGQPLQPGQLIAQGSKIDLEVANGLGTTEMDVPELMGKDLDEVKFIVVGSKLKMGYIMYVPDATEAPGMVIFQNPEFGSGNKIRMGETIDIKVAGPDPREQPQQQ